MTAIPPYVFTLELDAICADLVARGYSIQPDALPEPLRVQLRAELLARFDELTQAGIGRGQDHLQADAVRNDSTLWLEGGSPGQDQYLALLEQLRQHLNRQLFLGLSHGECHFAYYGPGHYYQKHRDAFRGQSNRLVSVVSYLNEYWPAGAGGELVIYNDQDQPLARISPEPGTLVVFLSEDFPHQVLPAADHRYSIAGWLRRDGSLL